MAQKKRRKGADQGEDDGQQWLFDRLWAAALRQILPANIVMFMRTEIPQRIGRPPLCAASGVTAIKYHRHKAAGET